MNAAEYIERVTTIIASREQVERTTVQCVWMSYVFGNIKGVFATLDAHSKPTGMLYEATYNAQHSDIWVNVYTHTDIYKTQL